MVDITGTKLYNISKRIILCVYFYQRYMCYPPTISNIEKKKHYQRDMYTLKIALSNVFLHCVLRQSLSARHVFPPLCAIKCVENKTYQLSTCYPPTTAHTTSKRPMGKVLAIIVTVCCSTLY